MHARPTVGLCLPRAFRRPCPRSHVRRTFPHLHLPRPVLVRNVRRVGSLATLRVVKFTTNVHRVVARRDRRFHVAMARRYDSRTTIFSPEGRLYQVEYAMEAIGHAGACVGVLAQDGIVLAAEKKITSKVRDIERRAANAMATTDANVAGRNVQECIPSDPTVVERCLATCWERVNPSLHVGRNGREKRRPTADRGSPRTIVPPHQVAAGHLHSRKDV